MPLREYEVLPAFYAQQEFPLQREMVHVFRKYGDLVPAISSVIHPHDLPLQRHSRRQGTLT
jgi:hypothetical protein